MRENTKKIFECYMGCITEAPRKIESFEKGNVKIVVVYNNEWEEYSARWYEDGKYDEDKTYYAGDDKDDCIATAKHMISQVKVNESEGVDLVKYPYTIVDKKGAPQESFRTEKEATEEIEGWDDESPEDAPYKVVKTSSLEKKWLKESNITEERFDSSIKYSKKDSSSKLDTYYFDDNASILAAKKDLESQGFKKNDKDVYVKGSDKAKVDVALTSKGGGTITFIKD